MLIVIPAEVQVFLPFRPWMNWVLLGLTCLVSGFLLVAPVAEETVTYGFFIRECGPGFGDIC